MCELQAVEEAEHLRAELRRESLLRKRAHNELRELKGNIRVLCRVRPATAGLANAHRAQDGTAEIAIRPHDEFTVHVDTVSKCVISLLQRILHAFCAQVQSTTSVSNL